MGEDQLPDFRALGDRPDFADIGVEGRHPLEGGAGEAMALEVIQVRDTVDEDVGSVGEGDQIVVDRGIAGEHDGAVGGVESIRERGNDVSVCHHDPADANVRIVEDGFE